jgi:hypothetical protein
MAQVRVYVLKGSALQPLGSKHGCDPYIKLRLGKSVVDDRKAHLSDTRNPMFHRGGSVATGSILGFALFIPSTPLCSCAVLAFEYKVVAVLVHQVEVHALGLHRSISARMVLGDGLHSNLRMPTST